MYSNELINNRACLLLHLDTVNAAHHPSRHQRIFIFSRGQSGFYRPSDQRCSLSVMENESILLQICHIVHLLGPLDVCREQYYFYMCILLSLWVCIQLCIVPLASTHAVCLRSTCCIRGRVWNKMDVLACVYRFVSSVTHGNYIKLCCKMLLDHNDFISVSVLFKPNTLLENQIHNNSVL